MQTNQLYKRIIQGGGDRPTRFHDERGNLVSPGGLIYAIPSFITALLRHRFGYYPPVPWLSYRAQRHIARLLNPHWIILEFGSGMSTAWFAQRCQMVYSFEHNPAWYCIVKDRLAEKKISNVVYKLRDIDEYPDLSEFPDHFFDFVLIDGVRRTDCVRNVLPKVKPNGWIYLDNIDMSAKSKPRNDYHLAEKLLLSHLSPNIGGIKYYTDFVPTNFFAKQGMLVNLRSK